MGPHVFACGNFWGDYSKLWRSSSLQWGRTFLRAEISTRSGPHSASIKLQWGRTFLRAEICSCSPQAHSPRTLQWGRTFLRAEIAAILFAYSIRLSLAVFEHPGVMDGYFVLLGPFMGENGRSC